MKVLQNLLTSKTGYVEIALRMGFGINLVFEFHSHAATIYVIAFEFSFTIVSINKTTNEIFQERTNKLVKSDQLVSVTVLSIC
jgi:limonene-1,2-epoxide hydrolase